MTMRLKRSIAVALALLMYVQPLAQSTFAFVPAPAKVATRLIKLPAAAASVAPKGESAFRSSPLERVEPSEAAALEQAAGQVVVFGPNTYARTAGPPNVYTASFAMPAGVSGPFTMHVVNGAANGSNRLASATITLNGVEVASPSEFSPQVAGFDKTVTLQAQNTVTYRLTSGPGRFMTVTFFGTNGISDTTPPQLTITSPFGGSFLNAATIAVSVQGNDAPGANGAASGLNQSSLHVLVDGADRAGEFTWANGQASASLGSIGEGAHTLTATIADNAGNTGSAAAVTFTVDRTAPQVVIVDPAAGQFTKEHTIEVRGGVIDVNSATVVVDGTPALISGSEFVATTLPVGDGPSQAISVVATDAAGNSTTASVTINVDRAPPVVAFTTPVEGAVLHGPILEVSGTVSDATAVIVDVNGEPMTVANGSFTGQVPASEGSTLLRATAQDAAGNQSIAERTIAVDSAAPVVTIVEPAPFTITNQASILVRGTVADASATAVIAGGVSVPVVAGAFATTLPLLSEGTNLLIVTATDAAGNESMADVSVISDRTAPALVITSPGSGAVVSSSALTVQGTVNDLTTTTVLVNDTPATVSGSTWQVTIENVTEGDATLNVVARDAAGNSSTASRPVVVDLSAPVLTISTPASGLLTGDGSVAVAGTVQDVSVSEVLVNGTPATLAAPAPGYGPRNFTATVTLSEGDNAIIASAVDAAGRPGSTQVTVTRDSTPPVVSLNVGPKVSRARTASASVIATDNVVLDRVTVSVNGSLVQTFTAPPFVLEITAPASAQAGDVLTVVAEAIDRVGNRSQSAASLPVVNDGAVVGQVLTDHDGRPVTNATIAVDGGAPTATDARGRYSFATGDTRVALSVTAPAMTTVDRAFDIAGASGTVALDARLTPIAAATAVGAAASTVTALPALSLAIPAGAFVDGSNLNVTPLSGQGLPGLLPLGWSPIAALDLRGAAPSAALTLRADHVVAQTAYLARYVDRSWHLASDALTPDTNGTISVALPLADAIVVALVVPDTGDGAPAVPANGDPLSASAAVAIPLTATSTGVLDPPVLSPGGGTSIGTLTVVSPTPLPSGTVVQAVVTETFTLTSGDTISEDARTQDFVLYRAQPGLVATFPVVPSRTFDASNLAQGIVHLDILAGRESARGLAGGSIPVTLTTTGATLSLAQGALTEDVPIGFQSAVLSSFLPATADVTPLLEFSVDFSGRRLLNSAELSVLASQIPSVTADDALVIVRVDSIEGLSRLVPVAIGERVGDRYYARATHGLDGITLGGRHVWYRVAGGVGFVRGTVDANGTGLPAIVETSTLAFTAMAAANGQYANVARPGDATVRARAAGTSLAAEASTLISLNADSSLDLSLTGQITVASITPAANAIGVSPAVQVEVTTAASITAASASAATIQFTRTSDPVGAVPYRIVLSGSGRMLAIVPLTRLADGATYAVSVSGLVDAVGGAISVPSTTFTTQSTSSPQYDLDKLVFTFPDDQGLVTLNGPPGTLAPGSTILVVNESTGEVSTLGVNNDGSVSDVGGRLVANIADRLIVTITDLQGRQTTFKRSEYVEPDGTTAVGNGGGEILGDGGVEVRIPEDAVMNGVAAILKIAAISLDQLPEGALPDIGLPGATASTALKLESPEPPAFNKEVDLAFPKPADAPDDATYFIYRRMDGPDGKIAYETLDYADVEGEGANAKVVTASYPFSGYVSSVNGFNAQGLDQSGAIGSQFTNYAILMFFHDQASPGRALGGVITGKVLRVKWDPGATTPSYEPVVGAIVSGVDVAGNPLFATGTPGSGAPLIATSQADGTYSLFDPQFTGGSVTVSATYNGQTFKSTAYEVDPQNTKSPGLRFARNVANATITFPAVAPAVPPSPVTVGVMTLDINGARKNSNGIVVAGEPLVVGVKAGGMTVQRLEVRNGSDSTEYAVRADPLAGQSAAAFEVIADGSVTFALPGTYTITATALNPAGGVAVGHTVIRAAAAGGGNNDSLPNDAPAVITARTVPKADATGVQIGGVQQIVFTEPVQNVPAGLSLTEDGGGAIGFVLSGVGPNGAIATVTNASIVTSITIQPTSGLKYGTRYTLSLSSDIVDTDDGANNTQAHKPLEPYTTSFTTFAPESIGQTADTFTAGGMTVIGDRAYVATPQAIGRYFTNLRLFDISDPTSPQEISNDAPSASQVFKAPPAWWLGMPVDVASDQESPLTGGPVVAVAVTPLAYPYHTSNVRLYDVSNDGQWHWIGAVSLGREPSDGMIRRIQMKGSMLYAATAGVGKGIQFVDLGAVQGAFDNALAAGEQSADYWHMLGQLNSTEGFAQEAIVQTIPVNTGSGDNSQLWDLAVTDLPFNGLTTAVVATGRSPLVIATQTDGLLYNGPINDGQGGAPLTSWGYGVAAGTVAGVPIAVVAALGAGGPSSSASVLAVVDLSNPLAPRALKVIDLPGSAAAVQDVVLQDTTVYIGTNAGTYVVTIADPENPELIGTIPGISGRLAFGQGDLLFGTYRGLTQTTHEDGGLRTATLGATALVQQLRPSTVVLDLNGKTAEPLTAKVRVIPAGLSIQTAEVELRSAAAVVLRTPVSLDAAGRGEYQYPIGLLLSGGPKFLRLVIDRGLESELAGPARLVHVGTVNIDTEGFANIAADEIDVVANSAALMERALDPLNPPAASVLLWEVVGSNATITPSVAQSSSGVFQSTLRLPTNRDATFSIRARLPNSDVVAVADVIQVSPGPASAITVSGDRSAVPADGVSQVVVTAVVHDKVGNNVADGTPVHWRLSGLGSIDTAFSETTNGVATVNYRAAEGPATVLISAAADGVDSAPLAIDLAEIALVVTPSLTSVRADGGVSALSIAATSNAGPPDPASELHVLATLGRVINQSPMVDGQATATFSALGYAGTAHVSASIGRQRAESSIDVTWPAGAFMAPQRPGIVGDKSEDGFVDVTNADNVVTRYPYRTSTSIHVTGTPNEAATLTLGDAMAPNVEPIVLLPMDEIVGTIVQDEYHDHDAQLTFFDDPNGNSAIARVSVDRFIKSTGAASLLFTGDGHVRIPSHPALAPAIGMGFAADFRITESQSASLISRAGSYALDLVVDGSDVRVRASVMTSSGLATVTSAPVSLGEWHKAAARFADGTLTLRVDDDEVVVAQQGALQVAAGDVEIGDGFKGHLDNARIYDLARPRLLTFANGGDTVEITIGSDGTADVPVASLGNLRTGSPNDGQVSIIIKGKDWILRPGRSLIVIYTVELWTSVLLALEGAITGDTSSVEAQVGDLVASFSAVGDVRDLLLTLYKWATGTLTTADYVVLAFATVGILTTIYPPGDFFVAAAKIGAKQLRRLNAAAQQAVGAVVQHAIKDFVFGRGRAGIVKIGKLLAAMGDLARERVITRIAKAIRSEKEAEALADVVAEGGEAIERIAAAADEAAARGIANADEIAVHSVEVLAAAKALGLDISKWGSDPAAIRGLERYLELQGSTERARKTIANLAEGVASESRKWADDIAQKFFAAVDCIPADTPGFGKFLNDLGRTTNHTQGGYGIMRLICDKVPELAGRHIGELADIIEETGQEGIDIVTRLGDLKEFWEVKYVLDAANAIKVRQIEKHLRTKVLAEYRELARLGKSTDEIVAAMRNVKFKVDVISPNASAAAKDAIVARINGVLAQPEFRRLGDIGFSFDPVDVIVRKAHPLQDTAKSLFNALKF